MVPTNHGPLKSQLSQIIQQFSQEKVTPQRIIRKNSRGLLVCGGPERCSPLPKITQ